MTGHMTLQLIKSSTPLVINIFVRYGASLSGNTTYVTWTEGDEEDRQIFFAKSTDDGDTFARICTHDTYAPSGSFNPQLAVSGNNVYVVWQEDDAITGNQDIFFKKSTDGGDIFTDEINLSKDPGGSGDPQIHVSGRNLYIVWDGTTPGANGIFLRKYRWWGYF